MSPIQKTFLHFNYFLFLTGIFFFYNQLPASAQGNKIDSLKKVLLVVKEDTSKVNILNALSRQLFLTGKYDTALICANSAKILGEKIDFKKGISNSYNNIGNAYLNKGDKPEALKNYTNALKSLQGLAMTNDVKKGLGNAYSNIGNVYTTKGDYAEGLKDHLLALKLRMETGDKKGIAISYTNIGATYYYQGIYPEALHNYLAALKIEKEMADKNAIARTYNNTGNIYVQQHNYPEAINNYSEALKIQQEINDKHGIGSSYNNIGAVYFEQKRYKEALDAFLAALKMKEEIGEKYGIGHAYINIGDIYFLQSRVPGISAEEKNIILNKALTNLLSALEILKGIEDKQGAAMCYTNLGIIYTDLHKTTDAFKNLKEALSIAKSIGSTEDIRSTYFSLASADSSVGDWKQAYEDHKLFLLYRDSLINDENTKKTVQAQMNFDFEQKEIKAKAEQDEKEALYKEKLKRQKLIGLGSAGILIFILLFSILLFNRYRLKQKHIFQQKLMQQQKEQAIAIMDTQEQERKRIAEDLHDSLGHLLSTVKLNLQTLPDDQRHHYVNSLQLLNQASTEIHNISFNLMPQTLEEEGLIPALYELTEKIRRSSLYDIMLQVHDMENFTLDKQTKFNIYRIVQEAVSNILKHADAKEINIQLIKQDDQLTIMIEDDGKGFNTDEIKKNGRGLRNITARAEWLHGTIQIDSTPGRGTTISIEIPIHTKNEN